MTVIEALGWNLVTTTVMAGCVMCLSYVGAIRRRPALLHLLWGLVLLKLITPPVISVPLLPAPTGVVADRDNGSAVNAKVPRATVPSYASEQIQIDRDSSRPVWPQHGAPQSATTSGVIPVPQESVRPIGGFGHRIHVIGMLASVSFLGTLVLLVSAIRNTLRVQRLVTSIDSEQTCDPVVNKIAGRLGIKRPLHVLMVDASISPMLWVGLRGTQILMPRQFVTTLVADKRESVIAHELAHLVRMDHATGAMAYLVVSIFWWNPVAWLARRQMVNAAETCCDAIAIELSCSSRKEYASTLMRVLDFTSETQKPKFSVAFGSGFIKRRIEMIGNKDVSGHRSRGSIAMVLGLAFCALLVPANADETSENLRSPTNPTASPYVPADSSSVVPAPQDSASVQPSSIQNVFEYSGNVTNYPTADIVINATPAPTPPDLRVTGFWSMEIDDPQEDYEQHGFIMFGFQTGTLRQSGYMMFKTDQIPLPFTIAMKSHLDGALVELEQYGEVYEGLLRFSKEDTRAVLSLRSKSDGESLTIHLKRLAGEQLRERREMSAVGSSNPSSGDPQFVETELPTNAGEMDQLVPSPPVRVTAFVQSMAILAVGDTVRAFQVPAIASTENAAASIPVQNPLGARVIKTHGQTDGNAEVTLQFFDPAVGQQFASNPGRPFLHVEPTDEMLVRHPNSNVRMADVSERGPSKVDGQWKRIYYRRPDGYEIIGTGPVQAAISGGIWKTVIDGRTVSLALVTFDDKSEPKTFSAIRKRDQTDQL